MDPQRVSDQGVVAFLGAAWRRRFDFPGFGPGGSPLGRSEAEADRGRGQAPPGGQILRKLGMDETDEIGQPDGIDGIDQIDGTDGMCQCRPPVTSCNLASVPDDQEVIRRGVRQAHGIRDHESPGPPCNRRARERSGIYDQTVMALAGLDDARYEAEGREE